jgi:integrase
MTWHLFGIGFPAKVVSERLGHKRVEVTMDMHQNVPADRQEDAAATLTPILLG